jgi:hypothetical protein
VEQFSQGTRGSDPLAEEIVRLDKQERVTGKVRVRTITDTVEEIAQVSLQGRPPK